jgi:DNA repair exonuclease SbcCD ATPase subunit
VKPVREDLETLLSRIRMDLSNAQQKITDLKTMLATLDIPTNRAAYTSPHDKICDACGEPLGHGHLETCPTMPKVTG